MGWARLPRLYLAPKRSPRKYLLTFRDSKGHCSCYCLSHLAYLQSLTSAVLQCIKKLDTFSDLPNFKGFYYQLHQINIEDHSTKPVESIMKRTCNLVCTVLHQRNLIFSSFCKKRQYSFWQLVRLKGFIFSVVADPSAISLTCVKAVKCKSMLILISLANQVGFQVLQHTVKSRCYCSSVTHA